MWSALFNGKAHNDTKFCTKEHPSTKVSPHITHNFLIFVVHLPKVCIASGSAINAVVPHNPCFVTRVYSTLIHSCNWDIEPACGAAYIRVQGMKYFSGISQVTVGRKVGRDLCGWGHKTCKVNVPPRTWGWALCADSRFLYFDFQTKQYGCCTSLGFVCYSPGI